MSDPIIPIDQIKKQAREAAERGDLPTACPHLPGTDAERLWKDTFYTRVYQLSGEATV